MTLPTSALPSRLAVLALALVSLAACSSSRDTARGDTARGNAARGDAARGSDDRVERQMASLTEAVGLTDAQATRVRTILTAQAADRPSGPPPRGRPAGGQGGSDPRAARRAETDRQIEAVLTEGQVERYRAWSASQAQQRPQGPPPRGQ